MRPRPAVRTSTAGGSRPPSRRPLGEVQLQRPPRALGRVHSCSAIGNQRHNGKTAKARTLSEGPPLGLPRNPVPTGIHASAGACSKTLTRQHTTHNPGHGPLSTGQDRMVCATAPGRNQARTQVYTLWCRATPHRNRRSHTGRGHTHSHSLRHECVTSPNQVLADSIEFCSS